MSAAPRWWGAPTAVGLTIAMMTSVGCAADSGAGRQARATSRAAPAPPPAAHDGAGWFALPPPGESWVVEAVVADVAKLPTTVRVAYRDHILAVHLTDLAVTEPPRAGGQGVVYLRSMAAGKLTEAAALKPGQRVRLRLRDWRDVARLYETIQRFELRNEALLTQSPCWGEIIP